MDKNEFIPAAVETGESALIDLGAASVETKGMFEITDEDDGTRPSESLVE